jgi:hypothetical protein
MAAKLRPLGANDWQAVADAYNTTGKENGFVERDKDSLKRKFATLSNSSKPTGNPTMPEAVQAAKRAQQAIEERAQFYVESSDIFPFPSNDSHPSSSTDTIYAADEVTVIERGGAKPSAEKEPVKRSFTPVAKKIDAIIESLKADMDKEATSLDLKAIKDDLSYMKNDFIRFQAETSAKLQNAEQTNQHQLVLLSQISAQLMVLMPMILKKNE